MRKLLLGLIGLLFAIPVFAACPSGQVEQTYTSATGTVTQNGTPSPDNPIEPVFYQQGNMILRKINDTYADSYDATTGKITRRVGVKVLDGTENWGYGGNATGYGFYLKILDCKTDGKATTDIICTNLPTRTQSGGYSQNPSIGYFSATGNNISVRYDEMLDGDNATKWRSYLAAQYAAGTPVTVYYPLATETTEDWNETTYCAPNVKIATTAYNTARFSPVVTELNDTIATIRSVVTNTINQTKAIADLQATKQTRPNETCPAGKKCLLVEDNDGQPHWYEIIENAYGLPSGYTQVDYVTNTAKTMIDTGVKFDISKNYEIELKARGVTNSWYLFQAREGSGLPISGISGSNSGSLITLNFKGENVSASQITRVDGNIYYVKGTINNGNLTLYVKDETAGTEETVTGTYTVTTGQSANIGLFGNLAGNYVGINSNVYFARIKEDGNYIMDYVPAKQGTTAGFYDKVSGTFKTATGLSAGPEI